MAGIYNLAHQEADTAAEAEGLADIEAGRTISQKAMKAWLLSWGTADELPPPELDD